MLNAKILSQIKQGCFTNNQNVRSIEKWGDLINILFHSTEHLYNRERIQCTNHNFWQEYPQKDSLWVFFLDTITKPKKNQELQAKKSKTCGFLSSHVQAYVSSHTYLINWDYSIWVFLNEIMKWNADYYYSSRKK